MPTYQFISWQLRFQELRPYPHHKCRKRLCHSLSNPIIAFACSNPVEYYIHTWYLVFTASVLCDREDLVRNHMVLKDPLIRNFMPTTDSINCLLVIFGFFTIFSCKTTHNAVQQAHLLCPSARCSLCKPAAHRGHPSWWFPMRLWLRRVMQFHLWLLQKTLASESKSYLIVININTNWLLFDAVTAPV